MNDIPERGSHNDSSNVSDDGDVNSSDGAKGGKSVCRVCGKVTDKLYQYDTCKICLVSTFQRLKPVLNSLRDPDRAS